MIKFTERTSELVKDKVMEMIEHTEEIAGYCLVAVLFVFMLSKLF